MTRPLNQGQQKAADGFFEFLFSDQKELIISGSGGVGKTYLMGALIDEVMPRYEATCELLARPVVYRDVQMTATTNKAAEVLSLAIGRPTSTIHSFLNLTVKEDFSTGKTLLRPTNKWRVHQNMILFVDECSMIDTPLRNKILEGTHNCKIVYVGDHCQLAPVMEPISPIYRDDLPFFELTEQMRTNVPELQHINLQMRHTVETGEFFPIEIKPGIIDWLDDAQMEALVDQAFLKQTHELRILAYTNAQVNAYNDHIRGIRQLPNYYTPGELLVNNSAVTIGGKMLSVEEEVEIVHQAPASEIAHIGPNAALEVCYATLKTRLGQYIEKVPVPVDRDHFHALIKYYQKEKAWPTYFYLKQTFPDLRPRDASTVHKAQGSTHESVFIDLHNISTCRNADQAARMLYVAFSRAKHRVYLYGNLAEKYGGLIH